MYYFSADHTLAIDPCHGTLLCNAQGVSHNEPLDTFIIVPREDIIALFLGNEVAERPSIFDSTKWKPKHVSIVGNTMTIRDPDHLITTEKGRKKIVEGQVSVTIDPETFRAFVEDAIAAAFFEISMMPAKESKERKAYRRELETWTAFADAHFDVDALMMRGNARYYTTIPRGILPR